MLTRCIMVVFALALSALSAIPHSRADTFQEAQGLHQQGKLDEAVARLEMLLQQNPRDARARFLKGVILTEQNRALEAIAIFTALTQDFPEMPEPYNNLAVLRASQGDYRAAREALEMAIRTHPTYATAHENLGDIHAALARQYYETALQLGTGNASARAKLGRIEQAVPGATPVKATNAGAAFLQEAQSARPTPSADLAVADPAVTDPTVADPAIAVLTAVEAWSRAWSRGDATAYLSHYASGFRPDDGQTRAQWEASRRSRLAEARDVRVSVLGPQVEMEGNSRAKVAFRQHYVSPTFERTAMKILRLVEDGGRWLIDGETTTGN